MVPLLWDHSHLCKQQVYFKGWSEGIAPLSISVIKLKPLYRVIE